MQIVAQSSAPLFIPLVHMGYGAAWIPDRTIPPNSNPQKASLETGGTPLAHQQAKPGFEMAVTLPPVAHAEPSFAAMATAMTNNVFSKPAFPFGQFLPLSGLALVMGAVILLTLAGFRRPRIPNEPTDVHSARSRNIRGSPNAQKSPNALNHRSFRRLVVIAAGILVLGVAAMIVGWM